MRRLAVADASRAVAPCLLLLALLFVPTALAADETEIDGQWQTVKDLQYGVTLYHFFQQHYFDALTEVDAARVLKRLPHHDDEARLLRGGMSLSYGMPAVAGNVFDDLLERSREKVDADRVWFYLGKLAWQRGELSRSADALERMRRDYEGAVADEGHYLKAMLALQRGEEVIALESLQLLSKGCPFKPYFFYNLGVHRAGQLQWSKAANIFLEAADYDCDDQEGRALSDRALTAAGFSWLAAGDAELAASAFIGVRLDGPESARAMLGYGWSFANRDQYEQALAPWQALSELSLFSASVRESLLALPFAYEQLQRPATALTLYEEATERYAAAQAEIAQAIEAAQTDEFFDLLGLGEAAQPQWLGGESLQPDDVYADYLRHLLSTDAVQVALREVYDLRALAVHLARATERLAVLKEVDRQQQESRDETRRRNEIQALAERRDMLRERGVQLRQQLQDAIEDGDGRYLADADQAALWQRLDRASQAAVALEDNSAMARIGLLKGLMRWQDSETFSDRKWRLQRAMAEVEALSAQSAVAYASLEQVNASSAQPVFESQIDALATRTRQQLLRVERTLQAAQMALRDSALKELAIQSDHLARSEGQARLAVARLYDLASPEVQR